MQWQPCPVLWLGLLRLSDANALPPHDHVWGCVLPHSDPVAADPGFPGVWWGVRGVHGDDSGHLMGAVRVSFCDVRGSDVPGVKVCLGRDQAALCWGDLPRPRWVDVEADT